MLDFSSQATETPPEKTAPKAPVVSSSTGPTSLAPTSVTQRTLSEREASGYNTLFNNYESKDTPFKGVAVSTKTVGELIDFSKPSGEYGAYVKPRLPKNTEAYRKGLTSTPMGKYQIVGGTLRDLVNRMKLPKDTVFNKATQDRMFLFYVKERLAMENTLAGKRKNLRGVWEGFKKVDDATLDALIKEVSN
jgi:hypothetical protein